MGKSGRSRLPWKEELGGSNPPTLTIKADPLGLHARYSLPPPGRKVGWAAAAGFDSFPDTRKTIAKVYFVVARLAAQVRLMQQDSTMVIVYLLRLLLNSVK